LVDAKIKDFNFKNEESNGDKIYFKFLTGLPGARNLCTSNGNFQFSVA
jgi:hypothetical protein